jgi:hypothetical protein
MPNRGFDSARAGLSRWNRGTDSVIVAVLADAARVYATYARVSLDLPVVTSSLGGTGHGSRSAERQVGPHWRERSSGVHPVAVSMDTIWRSPGRIVSLLAINEYLFSNPRQREHLSRTFVSICHLACFPNHTPRMSLAATCRFSLGDRRAVGQEA